MIPRFRSARAPALVHSPPPRLLLPLIVMLPFVMLLLLLLLLLLVMMMIFLMVILLMMMMMMMMMMLVVSISNPTLRQPRTTSSISTTLSPRNGCMQVPAFNPVFLGFWR